jgi:hypothetical protein
LAPPDDEASFSPKLMLAMRSVERGTALFNTWYVRNLSCCDRQKL